MKMFNSTIWQFWPPLLFQTALILAVPAQSAYTYYTGKTVVLQTVPVDPYELLRGYSQTLRYDISIQDNLRKLPGWQKLPKQPRNDQELALIKSKTPIYVILQAPKPKAANSSTSSQLPKAWKPIAVNITPPSQLPPNQIALKGVAEYGFIRYGLETYYIPEDQRDQINADLREARSDDSTQSRSPQILNSNEPILTPPKPPVVMEIKVNTQGESVPVSLWALTGKGSKQQVHNYRF